MKRKGKRGAPIHSFIRDIETGYASKRGKSRKSGRSRRSR